ncbi:MAG: Slp family lipoprotein [Nitrosomonas sp.]|nr:Slp family lipoprotein [Nitrosomonas sp.]MDP1950327.1 Slp family lipoprotein [Nitrosomonas sp.]
MQVLFYPLDYYGRPQLNKPSEGRFVIKSPEFLDPMVYATNRGVIAVGTIAGDIERMADTKRIWVPLITTTPTAIYLWPINYRNNYYGNCRSCYFRQLFW